MKRDSSCLEYLVIVLLIVVLYAIGCGIGAVVLFYGWNFLAGYFHFTQITPLVAFVICIVLSVIGSFFKSSK